MNMPEQLLHIRDELLFVLDKRIHVYSAYDLVKFYNTLIWFDSKIDYVDFKLVWSELAYLCILHTVPLFLIK